MRKVKKTFDNAVVLVVAVVEATRIEFFYVRPSDFHALLNVRLVYSLIDHEIVVGLCSELFRDYSTSSSPVFKENQTNFQNR